MSCRSRILRRFPRSGDRLLRGVLVALCACLLTSTVQAAVGNLYGNAVPAIPNSNPEGDAEIGTYFTSTVSVDILGFRWFAGPQVVAEQAGHTFTGKLWDETSQSIITFQDFGTLVEGWNEVMLSTPVTISANTGYVVSVNHNGRYPFDDFNNGHVGYFPVGTAPVTATRSGFHNPGVFPSLGPFPSQGGGASYFADAIFNSPLVTGDVDGDFDVDINDYVIIRNNFFKTPATFAEGDLTLSNVVDFDDFRIWKNAFPGGPAAAAGAIAGLGVPEPAALGMFGIGVVMLWRINRRRQVVR